MSCPCSFPAELPIGCVRDAIGLARDGNYLDAAEHGFCALGSLTAIIKKLRSDETVYTEPAAPPQTVDECLAVMESSAQAEGYGVNPLLKFAVERLIALLLEYLDEWLQQAEAVR